MAAEYTPILQEGSNVRKKTGKKLALPPKFQKVRFEVHKKFMNFVRIFTVCHAYIVNDDCIVLLKGN